MVVGGPPAEPSGADVSMNCIDAAVVQQMFGDDLGLFRSLLGRMLRDYADLSLPRTPSLPPATLRERVHKLKGSAGMIGATAVMRLAGAAERALQENRPPETVEGILSRLACALDSLRDEYGATAGRWARSPDTAECAPTGIADPHELSELIAHFDSQNLAAMDLFPRLAADLQLRLGAPRFTELREAVDCLDFQRCTRLMHGVIPSRRVDATQHVGSRSGRNL